MTDYPKRYQYVAAEIIKAIRAGTYSSGQRLPSERELAEQYGVSRPTVREAMIALDIQGLVEARHGSGIYVRASLPGEIAQPELDVGAFELTEARRLFEGETAALAAALVSDEELQEMERIILAIKDENLRQVSGELADRTFHVAIAKATRNSAIVRIVEQLWDMRYQSPLCRGMLERARVEGVQPRIDEHERILRALQSRNSNAARKAMREHLESVIAGLLKATETDVLERARSEVETARKSVSRRISV